MFAATQIKIKILILQVYYKNPKFINGWSLFVREARAVNFR